jgi:hypothetical protein
MANISGFLLGMADAPIGQMDQSVIPRFKEMAAKEDHKAVDLLRILDDCVRYSLCSELCISVMDNAWRVLLKGEGKTVEQGLAEATWRN